MGVGADNKIFAWDTQSGNIVASGKSAPVETKAVVFSPGVDGGVNYTFAAVGPNAVVIWGVDARRGLIGGRASHSSTSHLNLSRFWSLQPQQATTSQLHPRRSCQ